MQADANNARLLKMIKEKPGISDIELTEDIYGPCASSRDVILSCQALARRGAIERRERTDRQIGNYPAPPKEEVTSNSWEQAFPPPAPAAPGYPPPAGYNPSAYNPPPRAPAVSMAPASGGVRSVLEAFLRQNGWEPSASKRSAGVEVEGWRGVERWVISLHEEAWASQDYGHLFMQMIGELLTVMDDRAAVYSLALPDTEPFRGLWDSVPLLARDRLGVTALFIDPSGRVTRRP
jgi:hypothetical protein